MLSKRFSPVATRALSDFLAHEFSNGVNSSDDDKDNRYCVLHICHRPGTMPAVPQLIPELLWDRSSLTPVLLMWRLSSLEPR